MVPAPVQLLAQMVDDALRAAVCIRRNRDINAGDLRDLHEQARDPFYTRKIVRQVPEYRDKVFLAGCLFYGALGRVIVMAT